MMIPISSSRTAEGVWPAGSARDDGMCNQILCAPIGKDVRWFHGTLFAVRSSTQKVNTQPPWAGCNDKRLTSRPTGSSGVIERSERIDASLSASPVFKHSCSLYLVTM